MIRAVIFDMDGTLTDTEPLYRDAFAAAAAAVGVSVREGFHDSLVGLSSRDRAPLLLAEFGAGFPLAAFLAAYRARKRAALQPGIPLQPGALPLLAHLRSKGTPTAVATSATRPTALDILGRAGLLPLIDAVITRDDVAAGKPAPDTYLLAAQRLGVPPAGCLAVEDSAPGLAAARAAGMATLLAGQPDSLPRLHSTLPEWQARRA